MAKRRLMGRGMLWNADGNPGKFSAFGGINLSWDSQFLELPDDADFSASSFDFLLGKKATFEFSLNSTDANSWALLTGGTTTTSLSLHFIEAEPQEVALITFEATVDNSPLKENDAATVTVARVFSKDSAGDETELVQVAAAAEVAGESYSVVPATGVFTFAAGDAEVAYYFDYAYTGTAGTRVRVNQDDLPASFEFMGYLDAPSKGSSVQIPIHIPNLNPSMPDKWGADRLAAGGPITITCGVAGDYIDWYYND